MKASVVIPAYNAAEEITRTLEALEEQDFEEYEVIVVNDGSTDETERIVKDFIEGKEKFRLINQKNSGPAAARNHGAEEAQGKYLLFTDSDCVPEEDWVGEMVSSLEREGVMGIQGRYSCLNRDSTLSRFIQYEVEERYERMKREESIDFIGSYSAGYDREVFEEVGGFDEDFKKASGEDPELSYRLDKKGYKMVFNLEAIVRHEHSTSLVSYLKQNKNRGYWGRLLYRKHPDKKLGQSYNSLLYFLKIPLTLFLTLVVPIAFLVDVRLGAIIFLLMMGIHLHTSLFAAKREMKFLLFGPFILWLKFLFFAVGIIKGYMKF